MAHSDVKVCRICFAMDCELHRLHENMELYKGYEAVTGLMLADEEGLPPYLCTDCADRLLNFARFRHRSLRAHLMLLDILKNHDHISVESIQVIITTFYNNSDIASAVKGILDNVKIEAKDEDIFATDFLDEIKTECMADDVGADDLIGNTATAPYVETNDVVKEEMIDKTSDNDGDYWKLGTGEDDCDSLSEQEEKLNTAGTRKEALMRDLSQTEGIELNKNALQKIKLSCELCEYENDNETEFFGHLRAHAEKTLHNGNKTESKRITAVSSQYSCETCGKTFSTKKGVFSHVRLHFREDLSCDVCKRSFRLKSNLVNHMLSHFDRPHTCGVCNKSCRSRGDVTRHMKTHSSNKPYTCMICETSFSERGNLRRHELMHTGKRHACNVCTKTFLRKSYLKTHMLIHLGDRPYSCDVCEKSFRTKSALKNHTLTHTGEKPYSCDVCKKMFNRKCNLQNHLLLHDESKPFKCDLCDSSFRRIQYLNAHMLKHSGEEPYSCDVCKKKWWSKSNLLSHMRVHASDEP